MLEIDYKKLYQIQDNVLQLWQTLKIQWLTVNY